MTTEHSRKELDELMARLANGDRAVFGRVFEQLWGPTERLCRSLLKHPADAQDAAQEAMQKILERASDYDPKRPALPWAMAIAGWECRTMLRKRGRRRETSAEGLAASVPADEADRDGEQRFVERDLAEAAVSALGTLSDIDQEVLRATFWAEAGTDSSGEAGGVGGATFRKRRERALARLRETWRRVYGFS